MPIELIEIKEKVNYIILSNIFLNHFTKICGNINFDGLRNLALFRKFFLILESTYFSILFHKICAIIMPL